MSASSENLTTELQYSWQPFTLVGRHLSFSEHLHARLQRSACSWWGPAIYKWEGSLASGPNAGKVGVLIGETGDIRQRIKQYVSGTQERGNKLWRETFLTRGTVHLYTLALESLAVDGRVQIASSKALASNNIRLVLEQLLIMRAVANNNGTVWIVNARQ